MKSSRLLLNGMKNKFFIAWAVATLLSGCVTETTYIGKNSARTEQAIDRASASRTRVDLGLGYLRKGDMVQAKYNLEKALQFDDRNPDAHLALAYYFQQVGDLKSAEQSYRRLLAADDDNADGLNNYGVFLCGRKRYDEAEQAFVKALAQPTYVRMDDTYENAGYCAGLAGDRAKAKRYYELAIGYNPRKPKALLELAALALEGGEPAEAGRALSQYQAVAGENAESLWLRVRLAQAQGQLAQVHLYGGKLVRQFPNSDKAKRYLTNDY